MISRKQPVDSPQSGLPSSRGSVPEAIAAAQSRQYSAGAGLAIVRVHCLAWW